MSKRRQAGGPRGGVQVHERALRGWRWDGRGTLVSQPVRCKREEWYLARARLADGMPAETAALLTAFLHGDELIAERCLRLHAVAGGDGADELLGWIETPAGTTHLRLHVPDPALVARIEEIVFHNVSERDPKCHPLANVPRWNAYQPPFQVRRVVLPASLRGLARLLDWGQVQVLESPGSAAALGGKVRGSACVLDPGWVSAGKLRLADVERLAESAWVLVDLKTIARLVRTARAAQTDVVEHVSPHGIMSARVEYADVPTRGLALQDVVPYTTLNPAGGFRMQVLKANRSWKRYADRVGFTTLLSSETPWERQQGGVLSAARPVGGGELLATDLPWVVAGVHGPLLAPRIAAHLLRMHLGGPLEDHQQYWNRWDDGNVVVRDIIDLARRYPPLRAVRWASSEPAIAHLGIMLGQDEQPAARHLLIRTGRIDSAALHNGLPPEPLIIFMKFLAREARQRTAWARRYLAGQVVIWQFDAADGLKYAVNYDAAPPHPPARLQLVRVRSRAGAGPTPPVPAGAGNAAIVMTVDEGLHGDGSLAYQDVLTKRLRRVIERGTAG